MDTALAEGITIKTRIDVAPEQLDELVRRISTLLREYDSPTSGIPRAEVRMALRLFPRLASEVRCAGDSVRRATIRVWRARAGDALEVANG
jgi:hypothetical protein